MNLELDISLVHSAVRLNFHIWFIVTFHNLKMITFGHFYTKYFKSNLPIESFFLIGLELQTIKSHRASIRLQHFPQYNDFKYTVNCKILNNLIGAVII